MDRELIHLLTDLMPDAVTECGKCGAKVVASKGVRGSDGIYCGETCQMQTEALLIKRQPPAFKAGPMDV